MNLLTRVEQRLKDCIESVFRKRFKGDIQPVEIASALSSEMVYNRRVSVNRVYVPNHFVVELSQDDYNRLAPLRNTIQLDLVEHLHTRAGREGWSFVAPPAVTLQLGEVKKGDLRVKAEFVEGGSKAPEDDTTRTYEASASPPPDNSEGTGSTQLFKPASPLCAVLTVLAGTDEGTRRWLEGPAVLGRAGSCDVVLADSSVSRRHARIEREGGRWVIVDLGSTNGTFLNDVSVDRGDLKSGDRITMGNTVLRFEVIKQ